MPFLLRYLLIVNDKQTIDELNISIFSSQWNRFVSVLIVALIVNI